MYHTAWPLQEKKYQEVSTLRARRQSERRRGSLAVCRLDQLAIFGVSHRANVSAIGACSSILRNYAKKLTFESHVLQTSAPSAFAVPSCVTSNKNLAFKSYVLQALVPMLTVPSCGTCDTTNKKTSSRSNRMYCKRPCRRRLLFHHA